MNEGRGSGGASPSGLFVELPGMTLRSGCEPSLSKHNAAAMARISSTLLRYVVAVLSIAAALLAAKASVSFLNTEPFVSLFLCSILFSAWFGGLGPGLLATALAGLAFDYYLLPPIGSFAIASKDAVRLIVFFVPALFVVGLTVAQRNVAISLQRSRRQLAVALEEQRKTEASLARSEMSLAEAQRLSQTGSFGWKVATGELIWSAETFRIFGYSPSVTPTLDLVVDRVHPADRALVRENIGRASSEKRDFDYEFRLLMPDGTEKRVRALAHAAKDAQSGFEFIGAVMDITAAKQTELELRQSEQRFRDFAETASDWFWETDRDHRLIRVSRESRIVREGIGVAPWEFAADRDEEPEKWRDHFADLAARKPFREFRFRSVRDGGPTAHLSVSGKPVFDSAGEFLGYRGVASDITARMRGEQAEAALRSAQTDLAHAARVIALGELTTSIAHEVNQPLAAILSNAEACLRWLDRGPDHVGSARRSIEWIVKDVNRAAEVIGRVRSLARKTDTERKIFDINEVIKEVSLLLRRELAENRILFGLQLSPEQLIVRADRVQLQQVIMNLLMNGIEAMQSVSDRPREMEIRSQRNEAGDILVVVEDRGIGFSSENSERLFNAFFTTKPRGLGLGLSICRSILESHGGHLSAFRRSGPGSAFQFTLPLHQSE